MLINYTVTTKAKRFTMLTEAWPSEALSSCRDRFRDATIEANGGLINQVATKIAAMTTLQDRRNAVASIPDEYQEDIKAMVVELFSKKGWLKDIVCLL